METKITYELIGNKPYKVERTYDGDSLVNQVSNLALNDPNIKLLSLKRLSRDLLDNPLFRELNAYMGASPALKLILIDGILTLTEEEKLKKQLKRDLDEQILSQALYDLFVQKLGDL